jgi:hypothetical protein
MGRGPGLGSTPPMRSSMHAQLLAMPRLPCRPHWWLTLRADGGRGRPRSAVGLAAPVAAARGVPALRQWGAWMWGRLSAALVEGVVGGAAGAVRAVAMRASFAAGTGGPHVAHVRVCLDCVAAWRPGARVGSRES